MTHGICNTFTLAIIGSILLGFCALVSYAALRYFLDIGCHLLHWFLAA